MGLVARVKFKSPLYFMRMLFPRADDIMATPISAVSTACSCMSEGFTYKIIGEWRWK
jgi:hypothetical protein